MPPTISPWPYVAGSAFRQPHANTYIVGGNVVPPDNVKSTINAIYNDMLRPNRDSRVKRIKTIDVTVDLQDLYRLWWLSADICNLSGVKVSWERNDTWIAAFDRINHGGPYALENLQIVANCVNTAKWDHSNADALEWIENFKHNT